MRRGKYVKGARGVNIDYIDRHGRTTAERQETLYKFIVEYTVAHFGHTPTLREMTIACRLSSTSTTQRLVNSLIVDNKLREKDGLLVVPGTTFIWTPTDSAPNYPIPATNRSVEH